MRLYVSFGSKLRRITFGCVAMGISVFLLNFEVQIALIFCRVWSEQSEQSESCFVLSRQKLYVAMVVIYCLHQCMCVDLMVMSSA